MALGVRERTLGAIMKTLSRDHNPARPCHLAAIAGHVSPRDFGAETKQRTVQVWIFAQASPFLDREAYARFGSLQRDPQHKAAMRAGRCVDGATGGVGADVTGTLRSLRLVQECPARVMRLHQVNR